MVDSHIDCRMELVEPVSWNIDPSIDDSLAASPNCLDPIAHSTTIDHNSKDRFGFELTFEPTMSLVETSRRSCRVHHMIDC